MNQSQQSQSFQSSLIPCFIYFEGEHLEKQLKLTNNQIKNIRTLKKKILNQFKYEQSQGKKIQLNIMQIYPNQAEHVKTPITNEVNLRMIIQFLKCHKRPIKIQVGLLESIQQMKRKQVISQQALQNHQIHFDQNGSLIQETDPMGVNIPNNPKFDNSTGHERCEFCQKNNEDVLYLKRCGGLYGPFQGNKYVHLMCALWCHKVFLDQDTDKLRNVQQQIKRSEKKKCFYCKQAGAGLFCDGSYFKDGKKQKIQKECKRNFHFKCAVDSGSLMNWMTFKMLCPRCK